MADFNVYQAVIDFDGVGDGWSETYWLRAGDASAAVTNLQAIIDARKPMMHENILINYAHVSQLGHERQSFIVGDNVVAGDSTLGTYKPNRLEDCIMVRQQTAAGKFSNRYVHGIPDAVIVEKEYDPAAISAFNTALLALCTAIKANSGYLNKVNPADKATWTVLTWDKVIPRGATEHKVGRPFGARRGRRRTA